MQFLLRLELRLLTDFSGLVIETQPPPLVVFLCVPSHLIQLHLLLVIATLQEVIEAAPATPYLEHALLLATVLQGLPGLPALAAGDLVGFKLQPVFLETSEYV